MEKAGGIVVPRTVQANGDTRQAGDYDLLYRLMVNLRFRLPCALPCSKQHSFRSSVSLQVIVKGIVHTKFFKNQCLDYLLTPTPYMMYMTFFLQLKRN